MENDSASGGGSSAGEARPRMLGVLVCLALGAVAPRGARAELIEVTQVAGGMECFECARRLRLDVQKLDGVADAVASWNRRILTVRFQPGSGATLAALQGILRRHHFVPREAEVLVSGRLSRAEDGRPLLRVSGTAESFVIAGTKATLAEAKVGVELRVRGRVDGEPAEPPSEGHRTLWVLKLGPPPPATPSPGP